MKSRNVLYIVPHSSKQFGAEEKDLSAGLKILEQDTTKKVYLISIDLHSKKLIYELYSFGNDLCIDWLVNNK